MGDKVVLNSSQCYPLLSYYVDMHFKVCRYTIYARTSISCLYIFKGIIHLLGHYSQKKSWNREKETCLMKFGKFQMNTAHFYCGWGNLCKMRWYGMKKGFLQIAKQWISRMSVTFRLVCGDNWVMKIRTTYEHTHIGVRWLEII